MEYRLIALDMDGTVLDSKKKISSRTADAMKQAMEEALSEISNSLLG